MERNPSKQIGQECGDSQASPDFRVVVELLKGDISPLIVMVEPGEVLVDMLVLSFYFRIITRSEYKLAVLRKVH